MYALAGGKTQSTKLPLPGGVTDAVLERAKDGFILSVPSARASLALAWLRALSDGYVRFDDDLARKLPGPVGVELAGAVAAMPKAAGARGRFHPPVFRPALPGGAGRAAPRFFLEGTRRTAAAAHAAA